MTTTIGQQFRNPWDERYEYGRMGDPYAKKQKEQKDDSELCDWKNCENTATHLAHCSPKGEGCGAHAPRCVDHVLDTVSKVQKNPKYRVKHGAHSPLAIHITYTPKK